MTVYLNGKPLGVLQNGAKNEFVIPAGRHQLKAKIDTQGSNRLKFDIEEDETKTFVLSNDESPGPFGPITSGAIFIDLLLKGLLLLYYFTIGHNNYLRIRPLEKIFC